jgi:hypothetical protein
MVNNVLDLVDHQTVFSASEPPAQDLSNTLNFSFTGTTDRRCHTPVGRAQ